MSLYLDQSELSIMLLFSMKTVKSQQNLCENTVNLAAYNCFGQWISLNLCDVEMHSLEAGLYFFFNF